MTEEEGESSRQSAPRGTTPTSGPGGAPGGQQPPGAAATGPTAPGGTGEDRTAGPAPGGPEEPPAAVARRLTRSRRPKVVGGVCAGLGRYFDLDPVIFRVPLAVLSVVGGLGLVFYGGAWLLIPAEGERQNEARSLLSGRVEGSTLAAILVALVGCGLFLASLGNRSAPFSLLIAGAVMGAAYWSQHRRAAEAAEAVGVPVDPTTAHAVADAPPEAQAPPVPGTPSWWREPLTKDGVRDTGYLWGPEGAEQPGKGEGPAGPGSRRRCGGPRGRRERSFGGLVAMLASAAVLAGTAVGWDSRPLGASLTVGLACALGVYAIALVVSAFVGRVGFGTIFLVIVTAVMLAGASLIPKSIGTDWRDVTWTPESASEVERSYRLEAGEGELNLRNVRFTGDRKVVRTRATVGAGSLKVVVPRDARVELDADLGAGEIRMPSERQPSEGGFVVRSLSGVDRHEELTLRPYDGGEPKGTVELSVDLAVGQVEIVRLLDSGARTDGAPPAPPVPSAQEGQ